MLKVLIIVGARPNFMKAAPIFAEMKRRGNEFLPKLVHTGQHYDAGMSDAFFDDLGLPKPDHYLGVGSASHALQTANIMTAFEPIVLDEKPDWVVVVGDVNSTIACALVCSKLGVKVAHVEAGLRSFDRTMPEEINRILTDAISDLLLTTEEDAADNLVKEGVGREMIKFVGNVMIDSLLSNLERSASSDVRERLNISEGEYAVLTLHRPSNVDDPETLAGLVDAFVDVSKSIPVIFPAHPRTLANLDRAGLLDKINESSLQLIEPLGYLDFLRLYSGAKVVMTDSGGLQEETTALGIPCLTIRENTERPITISLGTNTLVGTDPWKIREAAARALEVKRGGAKIPPLWDGKAAERICDELLSFGESL